MSRPLRIEYAGAVYHIMARGNQGQKIYADEGDRKMWMATLVEARRRTGWRIHAWVRLVESSVAKEVRTMKSKLRNAEVS